MIKRILKIEVFEESEEIGALLTEDEYLPPAQRLLLSREVREFEKKIEKILRKEL